jgi:virginiamycin B lyase
MSSRPLVTVVLAGVLTSCSFAHGGSPPGVYGGSSDVLPQVVQGGKGAQWVQFTPHTSGDVYSAIVLGPDKNIWFLDEFVGLVRMRENGSIKEFPLTSVLKGNAVSMAVGADGKFYILDESTNVIRVTTKGKAQSFPIPSGDTTSIDGLALGPDGNIWFDEFSHIGRITPAGKITEFPYPAGYSSNDYGGVSAGSDGNVWFAESTGNAIGRIIPSTGKIKMFPIPVSCTPAPLVLAQDKDVWFVCLTTAPTLGSITTSGKITMFSIGGTFSDNETEQFCSLGPDGNPWCASRNDGSIFRVNTKNDTVTTFTPPLGSGVAPDALAAGADGNVWVDTVGGQIAVLVTDPITLKPNALTFSGLGQKQSLSVSEKGTSKWSAASSNTKVATVAAGSSASTFTVKSVGAGSCKITISDSVGNSAAATVTVK